MSQKQQSVWQLYTVSRVYVCNQMSWYFYLAHYNELSSVVCIDEPLTRLGCPAEAIEASKAMFPILFQLFYRRQTRAAGTFCKFKQNMY